jgi:hypothetical protein
MKKGYDVLDQFLSPELSKELKAKGYTEPCMGIYGGKYGVTFAGPVLFGSGHIYYNDHGAILTQQAEDWLFTRHGYSMEIVSYTKRHGSSTVWFGFVVKKNGQETLSLPPELGFRKRELARKEGIFHILKCIP